MATNLVWTDEYNLGVKIIDEQHKKFVSIIDKLYDSIQSGKSERDMEEVLSELVEYHNVHFATEEKYFKEFNYDGAVEHIAQHRLFTEKIDEYQRKVKEGNFNIGFDLIDYLEDWLVSHLNTMDKRYVECFHAHGLS